MTQPAQSTDARRDPGRRFDALLWALSAACVVPLWQLATPPLQDLPQHLAAIRVLHSQGDPAFGFAGLFELHLGRTQYLAYYLLADWLAYALDVELATKLLLSLALIATPPSLAATARALGGDPRVALLALPLTYNAQLILGFLNFVAAIPLCGFGLALAVRHAGAPTARRGALLAALLIACFYMHVVPFAFLALGVGLCGLSRDPRHSARALWPLLPALVPVALWVAFSPAGDATLRAAGVAQGAARVTHWPAVTALAALPAWLTDVLHGPGDLRLLLLTLPLWPLWWLLGLLRRGPRPAASPLRLRLWLLPLGALLCYFEAPTGYAWIWPIAQRFALLSLLLSLPLLPAPGRRTALALSLVAGLLGSTHVVQTSRAFSGFEREVAGFDAAVEAIPPGSRVAGLIFERSSRHVRFSPFLHYVALYQARRGGAVMFSFADFPQSPFSFRGTDRPPRVPPRWEWLPQRVRPTRDLGWYQYVLVRGGPGRIAREKAHYRRTHGSGKWSVWQRLPDAAAPR